MRPPGSRIAAAVASFAIVASLCVGMRPPSMRAFVPLPSVNLGSPLPSVNLGSPLPSVNLGSPPPTPSSAQPRPSSAESPDGGGGASPSSAPPSPRVVEQSSTDPPAARATEQSPVGTSGSDDAPPAERIGMPELNPLSPRLADVGSWLVPALGVGVPFTVAIIVLVAQVFGGAGAVHLARRVIKRIPVTARGHSLER